MDDEPVASGEVARLRALIDRILDCSAFTAAQQAEYRRRADNTP